MRFRLRVSLVLVGGAVGCSVSTDLPPDNLAPQVTFSTPQDGATVGGGVSIDVSAFDNYSVERVRILIDGSLKGTFYTQPYHYLWSTFTLPNNSTHTIVAEAIDPSNNTGRSQITVSVFNTKE